MNKLAELFKQPQITSLLSESDTELILGCLDPATGTVTRVAIRADMAVLPDEALLTITTSDEGFELPLPDDDELTEGPTGCLDDGDQLSKAFRRITPERLNEILREELDTAPPTWSITPRGEEIDLRAVPNRLF